MDLHDGGKSLSLVIPLLIGPRASCRSDRKKSTKDRKTVPVITPTRLSLGRNPRLIVEVVFCPKTWLKVQPYCTSSMFREEVEPRSR